MVVFNVFKVVLPLDPCPARFSPRPVHVIGISYSMTFVIPSVVNKCADGSGATLKVAHGLLSDNRRIKATRPIVDRYYNTVPL
jgi:hypothetical protein